MATNEDSLEKYRKNVDNYYNQLRSKEYYEVIENSGGNEDRGKKACNDWKKTLKRTKTVDDCFQVMGDLMFCAIKADDYSQAVSYFTKINDLTRIAINFYDKEKVDDTHSIKFLGLLNCYSLTLAINGRPYEALYQSRCAFKYFYDLCEKVESDSSIADILALMYPPRYDILLQFFDSINEDTKSIVRTCAIFEYKKFTDYKLGIKQYGVFNLGKFYFESEEYPLVDTNFTDKCELNIAEYEEWCWAKRLWINPLVEFMPVTREGFNDCPDPQLDDTCLLRLKDIRMTFDHCRRIMFKYDSIPEAERHSKSRDEDIEAVLDCHFRLYSILDKAAIVIDSVYSIMGRDEDYYFRDLADRLKDEDNVYLKGIYSIKRDMFPSPEDRDLGNLDPFFKQAGRIIQQSTIRNHLTHSTIQIIPPKTKYTSIDNVIFLTAEQLETHVYKLMYTAREVLLNLQLAINYDRNQYNKKKTEKKR